MEKEECHHVAVAIETPNVNIVHVFFPSSVTFVFYLSQQLYMIFSVVHAILLHTECGSCSGAYSYGGLSTCQ